ncbi:cupin domain-containing protein, partial [Neisseria sp. P0015.S010]
MDILDRLVELAQVKGSVDVQCLFQGEWYVRHEPKRAHGLVHIVTAGSGYIRIDGEQEARLLSAGDVIFFPRSVGHTLSSDSSCENLGVNVLTSGKGAFKVKQSHAGGDAALHLFCARFEYEAQADIMAGLPDTVLLNINHPSLQYLVALLQYESGQALSGSVAVVNALASVLLVFLLRASLEKNGAAQLSGLLNGWQDKRLRNLLQAVVDK